MLDGAEQPRQTNHSSRLRLDKLTLCFLLLLLLLLLLTPSEPIIFGVKKPPSLVVAKGSTVSLFPFVTIIPTAADAASLRVIEWEAHDHNVTGISTVPFQAPFAADATRGSSTTRSVGQTGEADGGYGSRASPEFTAWRRSTAVVYTCSMDGHCKEWEVLITGDGGEGAPVARCVSRSEVSWHEGVYVCMLYVVGCRGFQVSQALLSEAFMEWVHGDFPRIYPRNLAFELLQKGRHLCFPKISIVDRCGLITA